jgi:hypothetical protein
MLGLFRTLPRASAEYVRGKTTKGFSFAMKANMSM